MKKLLIFAVAVMELLACTGKNDPEKTGNPTITCNPATKTIDVAGGEFNVTIISNAAWSATSNKSWVKVYPDSGQGDAIVTIIVKSGSNDQARVLFSSANSSTTLIVNREEQLSPDKFSVSAVKKVKFSQGNLQYRASTKTWRFAEKQYDIIGSGNENMSDTYDGWIDLFCWGTGNNPTKFGLSEDYSTFTDWGVNAISNGGQKANKWRTLTKEELRYIFYSRSLARDLRSHATVCGVHGYVLLPDGFIQPEGLGWNSQNTHWDANTYDSQAWSVMEATGAIFLPAAGYRASWSVSQVGSWGYYWLASSNTQDGADFLEFWNGDASVSGSYYRYISMSVRLVQDVK